MITSVKLENFRGFNEISLENVKPITLISGRNNVGKSSLLEGIFLYYAHMLQDSFIRINAFRGFFENATLTAAWETAFHNLEPDNSIIINIGFGEKNATLTYTKDETYIIPEDKNMSPEVMSQFISSAKKNYTLKFHYTCGEYEKEGHFLIGPGILRLMDPEKQDVPEKEQTENAQFVNPLLIYDNGIMVNLFGKIERENKTDEITKLLTVIEPKITGIKSIPADNNITQLYAQVAGKNIPLRLCGDGVNKLLQILMTIVESGNGIVLVDEIENGFHYSIYSKIWQILAGTAQKYGTQLLMTTHSYEFAAAALTGVELCNRAEDFCYYRLDKQTGTETVKAHRFSSEQLREAIAANMEIR